jgi:hypothetical protein
MNWSALFRRLENLRIRTTPYGVHMSIVHEARQQGVEVASKMIKDIDFGDSLSVVTKDLMGRGGVAWGGVWKQLERFELGAG